MTPLPPARWLSPPDRRRYSRRSGGSLISPKSFNGFSTYTFTVPTGTVLDPDTTYFLVAKPGDGVTTIATDREGQGRAAGWSIADDGMFVVGSQTEVAQAVLAFTIYRTPIPLSSSLSPAAAR